MLGGHLTQGFLRIHGGVHLQQSQPFTLSWQAIQPLWISDHLSQHLVAAAQPYNMAAAPPVRQQINIPTLRPQKCQITTGGFTAWDQNQISVTRDCLPSPQHHELNIIFLHKRIQIIKIRHA